MRSKEKAIRFAQHRNETIAFTHFPLRNALVNVFFSIFFFSGNYTMTYIRFSLTRVLNILNHITVLFANCFLTTLNTMTMLPCGQLRFSANQATNTIDDDDDDDIDIDSEKPSSSKQKKSNFFYCLSAEKKIHCRKPIVHDNWIVAWKTSSMEIETHTQINFCLSEYKWTWKNIALTWCRKKKIFSVNRTCEAKM